MPVYITTAEVARWLGISQHRVQVLISDGVLPAIKLGRRWLVRPDSLLRLPERKPGRPRVPHARTAQGCA